ncbi:TRAP transporter small permease [Kineococcus sp. SYSU DK018]|uniref:TRAP transporter small permease n=1 Tax=Kineococcus sp. SYSU DK018 TaxID=3383139 RepID=UPI003D7DB191
MDAVKKVLDRVLTVVCVVLFSALVLTVAWQVFARQVLDSPSGWSEELAKYLFIWLGLLGAALVFGERGHIAVDVGVRRLPAGAQRVLAAVVQLAILTFAATALVWGGYRVVVLAWDQNLTGLPVNVGSLYLALPLCGVLVAFYALHHLLATATGAERATVLETDRDAV